MATHTLVYYGYYDASFHKLVPGQNDYWLKDGSKRKVEMPPNDIDGIRFGYMQGSPDFWLVQVDERILSVPVLFIGVRHGPVAPGPAWAKLDDDTAMQILVDIMVANPELRDMLGRKLRGLGTS